LNRIAPNSKRVLNAIPPVCLGLAPRKNALRQCPARPTYLHAWQITKEPHFKQVVIETLAFVGREMPHPAGGFYSSLDADSEGEEGKFYVWTLDDVREVLKDDAEFFEAAYGIFPRGNWEDKTVLQRALDDASLAARFKLDPQPVPAKLADSHSKLLSARTLRVRPGTDDKILTAWNGLMLTATAEASRALNEPDLQHKYLAMATRNAEFLLDALRPAGQLKRSWRQGKTTVATNYPIRIQTEYSCRRVILSPTSADAGTSHESSTTGREGHCLRLRRVCL